MSMVVSDPFAALEDMAHRQSAEQEAAKSIAKARVRLVLGKDAKAAWFATLALRLRPVVDWEIDTMATDGRVLAYNPAYANGLTADERMGVLAHEVMHNALAHHCRREGREPKRWNIACDLAINPILKEAGYTLPKGVLFPADYSLPDGLAAESYYSQLPQDAGEGQSDDPGGCGGTIDAGDAAECRDAEAEAQVAVAQATSTAKQKGELPAGIGRLVQEVLEPDVPWQDVLREFVSRSLTAKDDYSWSAPNRRYIANGLYLPSLRSEALGEVIVAIDTSGSIDDATLTAFAKELNGILECKPCSVTVLYCDAVIQGEPVEWSPTDGPLTLEARGGGGTSHVPIWDYLAHCDGDPACVVCLTDGYTCFGEAPSIPVLWCLTSGVVPPFGRSVELK